MLDSGTTQRRRFLVVTRPGVPRTHGTCRVSIAGTLRLRSEFCPRLGSAPDEIILVRNAAQALGLAPAPGVVSTPGMHASAQWEFVDAGADWTQDDQTRTVLWCEATIPVGLPIVRVPLPGQALVETMIRPLRRVGSLKFTSLSARLPIDHLSADDSRAGLNADWFGQFERGTSESIAVNWTPSHGQLPDVTGLAGWFGALRRPPSADRPVATRDGHRRGGRRRMVLGTGRMVPRTSSRGCRPNRPAVGCPRRGAARRVTPTDEGGLRLRRQDCGSS